MSPQSLGEVFTHQPLRLTDVNDHDDVVLSIILLIAAIGNFRNKKIACLSFKICIGQEQ